MIESSSKWILVVLQNKLNLLSRKINKFNKFIQSEELVNLINLLKSYTHFFSAIPKRQRELLCSIIKRKKLIRNYYFPFIIIPYQQEEHILPQMRIPNQKRIFRTKISTKI